MQTHKPALLLCVAAALAGSCALFGKHEPPPTLAVHEQVDPTLPETHVRKVEVPKTGLTIPINPFPALTERDLGSAELRETAGGPAILLRFDVHGTMSLQELTTRIRSSYIVIFLNGQPVAAMLIEHAIENGQLLLEGDFGEDEAKKAVAQFNKVAKKMQAR